MRLGFGRQRAGPSDAGTMCYTAGIKAQTGRFHSNEPTDLGFFFIVRFFSIRLFTVLGEKLLEKLKILGEAVVC